MSKIEYLIFIGFATLITISACTNKEKQVDKKLPILGRHDYQKNDTVYHKIADYKFVNQDSNWVTPETFEDKIYVADFFFTSCPSICPIMKKQMLRVYDSFQNTDEVMILSHTIDPKHDTVALLKKYKEDLGVTGDQWHFVTGDKQDIYKLGQTSYYVTVREDGNAPGGVMHSGAFILVDKHRRVRGVYDGTKPEEVDALIEDINILLKEEL
ncbi:MAG: SCO family protein [Fulvivirga sp.]|nr:SCO family protein [Fulvivirga sp.]